MRFHQRKRRSPSRSPLFFRSIVLAEDPHPSPSTEEQSQDSSRRGIRGEFGIFPFVFKTSPPRAEIITPQGRPFLFCFLGAGA